MCYTYINDKYLQWYLLRNFRRFSTPADLRKQKFRQRLTALLCV